MDEKRRRDGGQVAQHPKGRNSRRPRAWHRGPAEARRWLDAALLLELGQERLVTDAVMAVPAPDGHDGGQSAMSAGPSSTSGSNEGRRR